MQPCRFSRPPALPVRGTMFCDWELAPWAHAQEEGFTRSRAWTSLQDQSREYVNLKRSAAATAAQCCRARLDGTRIQVARTRFFLLEQVLHGQIYMPTYKSILHHGTWKFRCAECICSWISARSSLPCTCTKQRIPELPCTCTKQR
jgi:hypothetical protein